jgi:uncharacterized membrane protein
MAKTLPIIHLLFSATKPVSKSSPPSQNFVQNANKFFANPIVIDFLIIFSLSLIFLLPLSLSPWFLGHEGYAYLTRLFVFNESLKEGISYRWSSLFFQGYGFPFFNFYAPLSFIGAELFHLLGFSLAISFKLFLILITLLKGWFFYLFISRLWGRASGIAGAAICLFSPYYFLQLYWRGDIAEYACASIFPAVLYFSYRYIIEEQHLRHWIGMVISHAAVVLCHNISALFFSAFLLCFVVFLIFLRKDNKFKVAIFSLAAIVMALLLSAFFWLPAMVQKNLVYQERLIADRFSFFNHFVDMGQLWTGNARGTLSWERLYSGSRMNLGSVAFLATLLALIYVIIDKVKNKSFFYFFLFIASIAVLFMTRFSSWFWQNLPLLKFAQFPWRILSLTAIFLAVTASLLTEIYRPDAPRKRMLFAYGLAAVAVAVNIWNISTYRPVKIDYALFSKNYLLSNSITTTGMDEYTPKTVVTTPPLRQVDFIISKGKGTLSAPYRGSAMLSVNVENQSPLTLTISQFYFPGWRAFCSQQRVPIQIDPFGRMMLTIPPGKHHVFVRYHGSAIERYSNAISLVSLLLILVLIIINRKATSRPRRRSSAASSCQ